MAGKAPSPKNYNLGAIAGVAHERERILALLQEYFEASQLPGDSGIDENPEWDRGFQAAIALVKAGAL